MVAALNRAKKRGYGQQCASDRRKRFRVVCLGGSAGALEAYLEVMPAPLTRNAAVENVPQRDKTGYVDFVLTSSEIGRSPSVLAEREEQPNRRIL
jgi:hypothetical protein